MESSGNGSEEELKLTLVSSLKYLETIQQLKQDLPQSTAAYGQLNTHYKYGGFDGVKVNVYIMEKKKYNSLVFVYTSLEQIKFNQIDAYWNPAQIDTAALEKILMTIPNLTDGALLFNSTPGELTDQFLEALGNLGNKFPMAVIPSETSHTITLRLPEVKNIPCVPPEYTIERLRPEDCGTMVKRALYPGFETEKTITSRISKLSAYGAYIIIDGKKELVAWTHRYQDGTIGITHTLPDYRRKGLGAAITLRCAKDVIESGEEAIVNTVIKKTHNLEFHQKLGFQPITTSAWAVLRAHGSKMNQWLQTDS